MSLDEMRIKFSKVLTGRLSAVYKTSCVKGNPYEKSGVPEAFDWLALAIQISKSGKLKGVIQKELDPALLDPRSQTTIMQKLDSWLTRTETDIGVEEFIDKFRSFSLPSWDHYTHIRIAYVYLTKYGRQEGQHLLTCCILLGTYTDGKLPRKRFDLQRSRIIHRR